MPPDELQNAWNEPSLHQQLKVDTDLLQTIVRRDQHDFRIWTLVNDYATAAICFALIPIWVVMGSGETSIWTWYLMVPVLGWSGCLRIAYAIQRRRNPTKPDGSLRQCVEDSLAHVETQRDSTASYGLRECLPMGAAMAVWMAHGGWLRSDGWSEQLSNVVLPVLFIAATFYFIHRMSLRSLAKYEPRRRELRELLSNLGSGDPEGEADANVKASITRLAEAKVAGGPTLAKAIGIVLVLISSLLAFGIVFFLSQRAGINAAGGTVTSRDAESMPQTEGTRYAKKSPFEEIRWNAEQVDVRVDGEWFALRSIDGLPIADILAFCDSSYGSRGRKRFEEDLVEVLTRMGHAVEDEVSLEVETLTPERATIRKSAVMTKENRQTIYRANRARD